MDTVIRRFRKPPYDGSPKDFYVYRQADADVEGIAYREDWWNAEPGDWVLTNDGWVGELIRRIKFSKTKNGHTCLYKFSFAAALARFGDGVVLGSTPKLYYEPYRLLGGGYDHATPRRWDEIALRRRATKLAIDLHARMTIARQGKKLSTKDLRHIGKICFPCQALPELSIRRLFKSPLIKMAAEKRIGEILEERGVTWDSLLGIYDDALKIAREKKDPLNIIRVADRFSDLKQKYTAVEEHYDEEIEVEELPSARPPTPKLITNGEDSSGSA